MEKSITISNRQKVFRISSRQLQPIVHWILNDHLQLSEWDLSIAFLGPRQMARWNESHLNHEGPADILTYDYSESPLNAQNAGSRKSVNGELLICPAVAAEAAPQFGVGWPHETVRYVVHGILHLLGYDDIDPEDRAVMKRLENNAVNILEQTFDLGSIDLRP